MSSLLGCLKKNINQAHRYWRLYPAPGAAGYTWTAGAGNWHSAIYELELFLSSDASGTDLTTGKPAAASSVYSPTYSADKAIDNNTGTWWSTAVNQTGEQWIYIDLVVPSVVHSVTISPWNGGAIYILKNYLLQYSDNGVDWVTQGTFATANNGNKQTFINL